MKTIASIRSQRAFTLLEVIVSLIVVGIVAAMMVPFLGTAVTRSAESVISAQQHAFLNQVMENISANFKIPDRNRSRLSDDPLHPISGLRDPT